MTGDVPFLNKELEEQNQELQHQDIQHTRWLLGETLDLYSNLYDYAAVGCLTLDESGTVVELNLTGADLLKVQRDRLIGVPFSSLLSARSKLDLLGHLKKCRDRGGRVASRLIFTDPLEGSELLLISVSRPRSLERDGEESPVFQSALIDLSDLMQS